MSRKIYVDPARLANESKQMLSKAQEYEQLYLEMYQKIDAMGAAWKGADNTEYVGRINSYKSVLQGMKNHMEEYSEFLQRSSELYKKTQNDIVAHARTLGN